MNQDELLAKILENTFTKQDLVRRIRILKTYLENKFFSTSLPVIEDLEQPDIEWLNSLGNDFYKSFSKENIDGIFKQMEQNVQNQTPLVLYLAFEPDRHNIKSIGNHLRQEYGDKFIYDVKFDPSIIAGCALVWKGIYKDYSLKSKISSHQEEIITGFKQYVKGK